MEQLNNIATLNAILSKELEVEILVNDDSTKFWNKANSAIFELALPSFREGLESLQESLSEDADGFNYFSSMVTRVMSQPVTKVALAEFVSGFDITAKDPVMGDGFNYKASELSPVAQLLLFISVHRNLITLTLFAQEEKTATDKGGKGSNKR